MAQKKVFKKKKPLNKKQLEAKKAAEQQQVMRIRLPRGDQVMGIIDQRLGGSRMKVRCLDGKNRICRIPGRMKRYLWVREGDVAIIEPWEFGGDDKGDIVYKYTKSQVQFLDKKGYLKKMQDHDEF